LKQQVNPAIATVIVIVLLGVTGFLIWRGTQGPGGPAPGEKGNASPFAPGGAALGKGSAKPDAANTSNRGMSGMPAGIPRPGGQMGGPPR